MSLAPSKLQADGVAGSRHDSEEGLADPLPDGRAVFLWLRASLLGLGPPLFLVRDSCIRAIGVEALLELRSSHETVCEMEAAGCCIATGSAGLGSGQRWTSYDRLDPADERPAAGGGDEDSSRMAVEGEHVVVDSTRSL